MTKTIKPYPIEETDLYTGTYKGKILAPAEAERAGLHDVVMNQVDKDKIRSQLALVKSLEIPAGVGREAKAALLWSAGRRMIKEAKLSTPYDCLVTDSEPQKTGWKEGSASLFLYFHLKSEPTGILWHQKPGTDPPKYVPFVFVLGD